MKSIVRELWLYLKQEKKWWLWPMLIALGFVALLVVLGALFPGLAPFIYPLM